MAILGIGTDVVHIPGLRAQLADVASSFAEGVFTPQERQAAAARPSKDPVIHLAARYAAKEAFVKAWSSARAGLPPALGHLDLREIEVTQDPYGRPSLKLHGRIAEAVAQLGGSRSHLSLSHDGEMATAFVVLERT